MKIYVSILVLMMIGIAINGQSLEWEPYTFETREGRSFEAELGTLMVPENRDNQDSRWIKIKFVRFKSTADNPGSPVVYLAGGPGGSGVAAARGSRFDMFMALRQIGDVIALDQRGTGMSDGFPNYNGFWIYDPGQPLDRKEVAKTIQEETKKAVAYWKEQGMDVNAFNTNSNADDINDLRKALGAEKLNLVGISYGTHLALTYLKRHESNVDRMILAGVEGYDHTVKMPDDQQKLLEKIDQLLKEDPSTAHVYPNFLGDVRTLLKRMEESPIAISTINPMTKQPMEVMAGKVEMQILIANMLRGPSMFKSLPREIKEMLNGDFSAVQDWILFTHSGRFRGMSLAMDIASGISQKRLKLLKKQREETLLGDAINWPYLEKWAVLKELDLGDEFRASFASDKPVLCISGTLDGRTPPGNAIETLEHLSNGHHLIIEGAGHSDPLFLSSPRIKEVMLDFLEGKNIEDEVITLPSIEWELPQTGLKE